MTGSKSILQRGKQEERHGVQDVFGEGGNQNRACGRDWWAVRQEEMNKTRL